MYFMLPTREQGKKYLSIVFLSVAIFSLNAIGNNDMELAIIYCNITMHLRHD